MDRYAWMNEPKHSDTYKHGVNSFMTYVQDKYGSDQIIRCPCQKCRNIFTHRQPTVKAHLLFDGIDRSYHPWSLHGEEAKFRFCSQNVPDTVNVVETDNIPLNDDNQDDESFDDNVVDILNDIKFAATMSADINSSKDDGNNVDTSFVSLLNDSKEYLFPGQNKYTKFSFVVKLMHLKVYGKFSKKTLDGLLSLLRDAIPGLEVLPKDAYHAKEYLKDLGMGQEKIDVCKYDCMLYWNEKKNDIICSTCGTSRYKFNDNVGKPIPHKVLRYFPLIPRLKRLFLSSKTASDMLWHKSAEPSDNNIMSHPRDSYAWKKFNIDHPSFAADGRNVYLGLASDGFNPFGNLSLSYSMWPVIVTIYNLPPWKCMKPEYFIMPLLIPGPSSPGMDIDVFLEPLIEELKILWHTGIQAFDSFKNELFTLRAVLLWIMNDFPAFGILSGYQTKGYFACPICKDKTPYKRLRSKIGYIGCRCFLPMDHPWRNSKKFNGEIEKRGPPIDLTPAELLDQVNKVADLKHGKHPSVKKRRHPDNLNWRKKSIFFELPYWSTLVLRHNVDMMHVEKNILEKILWTILNVDGKSKDTLKARMDLQDMNIRKELHLHNAPDGGCHVPVASYTLSNVERKQFCEFLKNVRMPDGYASHIGRCVDVNEGRISGLKTHDCHVLLQRLLPAGLRAFLPKDIAMAISELGHMFKRLCKRTVNVDEIRRMQDEMVILMCKFEMIFPPAFFDIMVHLALHLPREVLLAGPVAYRWMYPIERFLSSLKHFVRNRACPEGSIAQAYITHESLTWCSMYIGDMETRFNRKERNFDIEENDVLHVFKNKHRTLGAANYEVGLTNKELEIAKWYIINNSDEVQPYLKEHESLLGYEKTINIRDLQRQQFPFWFKRKMSHLICDKDQQNSELIRSLYSLACGPGSIIKRYNGIIVNGVRYNTEIKDQRRKCQNSSVMVNGTVDDNDIEFYGTIVDIFEFQYLYNKKVFLFKCKWWDRGRRDANIKVDGHIISVKVEKTWFDNDPFILATQAKQIYFLEDLKNGPSWRIVQKHEHRHIYDMSIQLCDLNNQTDVEAQLSREESNSDTDDEADMMHVVSRDEIEIINRADIKGELVPAVAVSNASQSCLHYNSENIDKIDDSEEEDDTWFDYISSSDSDNE